MGTNGGLCSGKTNLTCSACPADTQYTGGVCVACAGNTTSVAGSVDCQCKAGFTYTPSGCQACPAGTYKRAPGTSACRSCQANSGSQSGSALCACAAGYTGNTGDVCVACVAGKYKSVTGSAACVSCAYRRNSPVASANITSCICDAGYTQPVVSSWTYEQTYAEQCYECAAGKFKPLAGVEACTPCAQSQSSLSASTVCSCVPGFTGPDGGPCSQCTVGTYKDWLGSQPCTACPAYTNTALIGSALLRNCTCNTGYTGPDGGACVACVGGTYKDVTGSSLCPSCPANSYSTLTTAAASCTMCSAGFKSLPGSIVVADCCDANTTIASSPYYLLSAATRAVFGYYYAVRVSSSPLLGLRATSAGAAPTYVSASADGYKGQGFLRFSKTTSTSGHKYLDADESTVSFTTGLTVVTVVRFLETIRGAFWSMQRSDEWIGFEIYTSSSLQLCVNAYSSNFCTDTPAPANVWLLVSYTYNPSAGTKHLLKVVYTSTNGATLTLSKTDSRSIDGFSARKYALGYSADTTYSNYFNDIAPKGDPQGDRPNFDLAGFYFIQTLIPDADVAVILQAIGTGDQIAYERSTSCPCNAGFGGTGRSDCKTCAPGSYKSEVSSVPCSLCPTSMYSFAVQALNVSSCVSCPEGTVSMAGEIICFCAPGSTGPNFGPCASCAASTFKNWRNSSACVACPANSDSVAGTLLCPCNVGYTGPLGGPCVACVPGKYKNSTGTAACTTCPAQSYEPDVAATAVTNCTCNTGYEGADGGPCTACVTGKYKATNGSVACVPCPVDTYIDVQASAFCKACPQFTTSPVGSTSIYACICKLGYTYDEGADISDPLSTLLATSPAYLMTSAEAWDAANSRFTDLSGNGRHGALTAGTVSVGQATGNGAGWSIPFVQGTTPTTIQWPAGSIQSTFTICSITRYTGGVSNRILDAGATWLHGHHGNKAGSMFYGNGNEGFFFSISPITNWVIACGRNIATPGVVSSIANGVVTSTAIGGGAGDGRLRINTWGEKSDWQLSRLYVWNGHLSNTDFADASAKLNSYVALRMSSYYFCSACQIGKYKDTTGSALCTSCAANTYSAQTNATSVGTCLDCPGNSTSVVASASKDYCQCNVGFSQGAGRCAQCVPGTFNPRLAQLACSNCTVGTYSLNVGATSNETCASCSGTEYSPEGSPVCLPCPAYSVAPARSGLIQNCGCIPGYTGATASLCVQCAPGTFKNITGNWLCQQCSANSYSLSGATSLTACFCNAGFFGAYGPLCAACSANSYSLSRATSLTDCICNAGYTGANGSLCAACVPGKYKSATGPSACIDCPANTYADSTGRTVCTSCATTSASPVASASIWNCTCNAGYKGPTYEEVSAHDNFARSCGLLRSSACAAAQSSSLTYAVLPGVYDVLNPAMLANDNSSETMSTTTYGSNQWWRVDFGRRVTVRSFSVLLGSYGTDMLYVHVGDVTTSTGNLICDTISIQSIGSDWVSRGCATPLTGQYLYVRNSVATEVVIREIQVQGTEVLTKVWPAFCEKCPAATYKAVTGNVPCTACPSNTFSATLAATNSSLCLACPVNSASDAGSQQCACVAGFSGSADACSACPLGTFRSAIGDISCATCPANSIMAENASSLVMPCTCLSGFEPR